MHEFRDIPLVSISNAQRPDGVDARWVGTVYHGLPPDLLPFRADPDDYVAFIGRISPEKRVDRAIEIAQRAGVELRIAAKVDVVDREYFEAEISPCSSCRASRISARSTKRRRRICSAAPARCSSRSTGRSPSAWW